MTKFSIAPFNFSSTGTSCFASVDSVDMAPCDVLLKTTPDGKIQASRSRQEKKKCPDRISLDRRGLTKLPVGMIMTLLPGKIQASRSHQEKCPGRISLDRRGLTKLPVGMIMTLLPGKIQASRSRQEKEKCPDRISLDRRGLAKLPVGMIMTLLPAKIQASRSRQEKEKCPDRISLDRRGLTKLPVGMIMTLLPGKIQASRSRQEKEKCPDRISLDRRGLTKLPVVLGEPRLRLLSLQHNLITRLDGFATQNLPRLVFLDLYDNQLERVGGLDTLENLRVLLLGKNRIRRIEGLNFLCKLEVLDLHGNQIYQVGNMSALSELKVLNLAGNQIRVIGATDLQGLRSLQELNLRRNRIKRLLGFAETQQLQKLFLSNNELQLVDHMSNVARATQLRELTLDGNPVALGGDYVTFLVGNLPHLKLLSHMEVTDAVRRSAMMALGGAQTLPIRSGELHLGDRREEVISNARTNWELLRAQTRSFKSRHSLSSSLRDLRGEHDEPSERHVQSDSGISIASSVSTNPAGAEVRPALTAQKKRLNFARRTVSQDSRSEFFRLPPILAPLLSKSDEKSNSEGSLTNLFDGDMKRWDSLSSVEPNVDSSLSSLPSDTSSGVESEDDTSEDVAAPVVEASRSVHSATPARRPPRRLHARAATCRPKQQAPGKVREQGGDFLVEIAGRVLNIYGQGALRFIDRPWNSSKAVDVTTVKFNYINYNSIVPVFPRLKQRFPNVEHFVFRETSIGCLGQLNALADVQGLTSLTVEDDGNPIAGKSWRSYAVFRLAHWGLKTINQQEVTEQEIASASEEFSGLSDVVLWSLPECLLQPLLQRLRLDASRGATTLTAKQWLMAGDPALRAVVAKEALTWRRSALQQEELAWRHKGRAHLSHILETAVAAVEKLRMLDTEWPAILREIVQDTLVDYSNMDAYMKKCLQELRL